MKALRFGALKKIAEKVNVTADPHNSSAFAFAPDPAENGAFSQKIFRFLNRSDIPAEKNEYQQTLSALTAEDRARFLAALRQATQTGVPFHMIFRNQLEDVIYCEAGTEGAAFICSFVTFGGAAPLQTYFDQAEKSALPQWRTNGEGRVTYANAAARELLNLQVGASASEPERGEIIVIQNGNRRPYRIAKQINPENSTDQIFYAVDITEEKIATATAQKAEQGQKVILEALHRTGAALFDSKRKLRFYNQAFVRLWNADIAFLETAPDYSACLDQLRLKRALPEQRDFKEWREEQLKIFHADENEYFEEMWHLPDHRTMRVALKPHPAGGLIAFYEDCTDRLRLESSYKSAANNLQETLNALSAGVALFDFYGKMKVCNKNIFLLGKTDSVRETFPENPTFSDLYRYYAEKDAEIGGFWAELVQLSQKNGACKQLKRIIACGSGETVYEARTETAGSGDILVTFTDITAEQVARVALSEKTDALIAASHMRDTFLKHLSYEMRNPMTAVIGFSEALREEIFGKLNGKQSEYVADILNASRELLHIIDNMLDLVRFQKDDRENRADFKPIPLSEMISNAITSAQRRFAGKPVHLRVMNSLPDNMQVTGELSALQQALFQILLNAYEAVPFQNGEITVTIYAVEDEIHLAVRDNGRGVPSVLLEKMNASGAENYGAEDMIAGGVKKGAGFGLNFVKRVCRLHRAELFFASAEGFGSCVKMIFRAV